MVVVDANVALAWVLEEQGTSAARALFEGAATLWAPEFLVVECGAVLATKHRRNELTAVEARAYLTAIAEAPIGWLPDYPLALEAQPLALRIGHSAYDCLYLAAAIVHGGSLATLDARFVQAAAAAGYGDHLRLLGA